MPHSCDLVLQTELVSQLRDSLGSDQLSHDRLSPWASERCDTDLVEVLGCRSHLFPGLVQQLDADSKELFEGPVVGKEHGVVVVASFVCCGGKETGTG